MPDKVSRRLFAQWVGAASASAASAGAAWAGPGAVEDAGEGAGEGARSEPALDLRTPRGNLQAYMKLHTSSAKARIWYWYTGIMEGAAGDGRVMPVVAIDTLIRRDVSPVAPGRFAIEMFEANYFHAIGDSTPLRTLINPLNGREVEPFHYREGPHHVIMSDQGIYAAGNPPPKDAPGFAPHWQRAGDQIWTTNTFYIDRPHPLSLDRWPLEGNVHERVGSFANLFGSRAELADPGMDTAKCTFVYEAFMGWWPWMLMGATPGHMLWHAGGRKLGSLEDMPAASRRGFETMHPRIFEERPWEELSMLTIDYPKQRRPVLR